MTSSDAICSFDPPPRGPWPWSPPDFRYALKAAVAKSGSLAKQYVFHENDEFLALYDGYAKARVHLLIVPKNKEIDDIMQVKSYGQLLDLITFTRGIVDRLESKSPQTYRVGIHARPSLKQLHVHIIGNDFDSESLKNKQHWRSFQAPFFIGLDLILKGVARIRGETEKSDDLSVARPEKDFNHILRDAVGPLVEAGIKALESPDDQRMAFRCPRCVHCNCGAETFKTIPALKRHLAGCDKGLPPTWGLDGLRWDTDGDTKKCVGIASEDVTSPPTKRQRVQSGEVI